MAMQVLAVALVVSPGVPHVDRRTHYRIRWGPGELVACRRPMNGVGNRDQADNGRGSVAKKNSIRCKPILKCRATPCSHCPCEARFKIEEQRLAGAHRGIDQWIGNGRLTAWLRQLCPRSETATQPDEEDTTANSIQVERHREILPRRESQCCYERRWKMAGHAGASTVRRLLDRSGWFLSTI